MKTARLVKDCLEEFTGHAALYEVDPPMVSEGGKQYKRVVLSSVDVILLGPETIVFPASNEIDDIDEVDGLTELEASQRGDFTHEEVLNLAGYQLVNS